MIGTGNFPPENGHREELPAKLPVCYPRCKGAVWNLLNQQIALKSLFFLAYLDLLGLSGTRYWWRFRDSNPGPVDYDSIALTD